MFQRTPLTGGWTSLNKNPSMKSWWRFVMKILPQMKHMMTRPNQVPQGVPVWVTMLESEIGALASLGVLINDHSVVISLLTHQLS
jgi:hypothetical protein